MSDARRWTDADRAAAMQLVSEVARAVGVGERDLLEMVRTGRPSVLDALRRQVRRLENHSRVIPFTCKGAM